MLLTAALALPMDDRAPRADAATLSVSERIVATGAWDEVMAGPQAAGYHRIVHEAGGT